MSASTELDTRPACNSCGVYLNLRPGFDGKGNGSTVEQRAMGVWYDHPPERFGLTGHTVSVLYPSPEVTL